MKKLEFANAFVFSQVIHREQVSSSSWIAAVMSYWVTGGCMAAFLKIARACGRSDMMPNVSHQQGRAWHSKEPCEIRFAASAACVCRAAVLSKSITGPLRAVPRFKVRQPHAAESSLLNSR